MTIALRILGYNGVALAADTQVSVPGYWKTEEGKVVGGITHRREDPRFVRSGLVSGAGPSLYIRNLMTTVSRSIMDKEQVQTLDQLETRLTEDIRTFNHESVVPFAASSDPPNVYMLIAAMQNGEKRLWSTDRMVLHAELAYASVGIGQSYADSFLGRLWTNHLDVRAAAILAAYVIYQVKQFIEGCGSATDLLFLESDSFMYVPRKNVARMEQVFTEYTDRVEPSILQYGFGVDVDKRAPNTKLRSMRTQLARLLPARRSSR